LPEVTFKGYCRWVTLWSAALAAGALVMLSALLLPKHSGIFYALAIGFAASIVKFRIACIDTEALGDMAEAGAVKKGMAGAFGRYALMAAALVGAGVAGGFTVPVICVAAGGLCLTNAVMIAEVVFGLSGAGG